jgi:cell division protein FtsB
MQKPNFDEILDYMKQKQKLVLLLAFVLAIAFIFLSNYGIFKRISFELDNANLQSEIQLELTIKDSLNQRIEQLRTDRHEIEKIAREKYGMIKPGESIIFYKKDKKEEE